MRVGNISFNQLRGFVSGLGKKSSKEYTDEELDQHWEEVAKMVAASSYLRDMDIHMLLLGYFTALDHEREGRRERRREHP